MYNGQSFLLTITLSLEFWPLPFWLFVEYVACCCEHWILLLLYFDTYYPTPYHPVFSSILPTL